MKKRMKEWKKCCFEGELTMQKTTLWLIGAVCLLAGIVYGLKTAPLTHGIIFGSNNGTNNNANNNSGNVYGSVDEADEEEADEDEEEEAE